VLLAAALAACAGSRSPEATHSPAPSAPRAGLDRTRRALIGCLRRVGADAIDVSRQRDLRVSGGEIAVAFSTFDAYVGLAAGPAEAREAGRRLDEQLTVLGQAGQAAVEGNAVYYYDAPLVPAAAGRLVAACTRRAEPAALAAMISLSNGLPRVEFPAKLATAFAGSCLRRETSAGCACAYGRASRLYRYGQIIDIAARPAGLRLAALIRMCVRPPTAA